MFALASMMIVVMRSGWQQWDPGLPFQGDVLDAVRPDLGDGGPILGGAAKVVVCNQGSIGTVKPRQLLVIPPWGVPGNVKNKETKRQRKEKKRKED